MEKAGFSKDVCRSMIAMMDWDRSGKLGFEEFKRLWIDIRQWKVITLINHIFEVETIEMKSLNNEILWLFYRLCSRCTTKRVRVLLLVSN